MKIRLILPIVFAFAFPHLVMPVEAQVVPGSGQQIVEVFDDFEDPNWSYTLNLPKSSANIDKVERHPSGFSTNRLYLESLYRGTPDFVRRIETPPGGIRGSKGALAMQTLNSGIPGELSHKFQQDDLIAGVQQKLGYMLPVSWTPSYVCRVYLPPFDKWERRHGSHFGFRADCTTTIEKPTLKGRFFKNFGSHKALEQYWPGFFIQLNMKEVTGQPEDSAMLVIRGDDRGHEVPGPKITRPGWWTLGLSFTPNGEVHFYAQEGVADLTARDHIYSSYPYGYKCEQTSTFFFNIVNQDDGRSWSTRWIVDDPKVYVATGSYRPSIVPQVAQQQPATVQPQVAPPEPPSSAAQTPAVQTPATVQTAPAQAPAVAAPLPTAKPVQTAATPAAVVNKPVVPSVPKAQVPPAAKAPATAGRIDSTIPKLASKPADLIAAPPKKESMPEVPVPTPAAVPESSPDSTKPVPASPVIDANSVNQTSATVQPPAAVEQPAAPANPE